MTDSESNNELKQNIFYSTSNLCEIQLQVFLEGLVTLLYS